MVNNRNFKTIQPVFLSLVVASSIWAWFYACGSTSDSTRKTPKNTNPTPTTTVDPTNPEDPENPDGDGTQTVPDDSVGCTPSAGSEICPVESILVEDKVTHTSLHNVAKYLVTQNKNGVFFTYAPRRYETSLASGEVSVEGSSTIWRLMRVGNDGKSFEKIFEETCKVCNAPAIDSDDQGNIFLATGDPDSHTWLLGFPRDARLFRFDAASNYQNPQVSAIPNGNSDKFRLVFDPSVKKLYYYTYNGVNTFGFPTVNSFYTIGLSGGIDRAIPMNRDGSTAKIMYPHVVAEGSRMVAGWVTERGGLSGTASGEPRLYRNISFVYSDDSGSSWKNFAGQSMTLPIVNDPTGPGTMVTFPKDHPSNEEGDHNWLGDMLLKNSKLHISYQIWGVMHPGARTHYSRYNFSNGQRDVDIQPDWNGIAGQGHFVTDPKNLGGPLYIVSTKNTDKGSVLAILISVDEGVTWTPYAEGSVNEGDPAALDVVQSLHSFTSDGYIVGLYSRCNPRPSLGMCGTYVDGQWIFDSRTYFFKVKAKTQN